MRKARLVLGSLGLVVGLLVLSWLVLGTSAVVPAHAAGPDVNQCDDNRDNDADGATYAGRVNDGCPAVGVAESGAQCTESIAADNHEDTPADGRINDGCDLVGTQEEDGPPGPGLQCGNSLDDDGDTKVNDGCQSDGTPEIDAQCDNAIDDDDGGSGPINEGCPAVGPTGQPEVTDTCANATDDDDLDGRINDGCPMVGLFSEAGIAGACDDGVDAPDEDPGVNVVNDDTVVNDGCPEFDNTGVTGGDNSEAPTEAVGGIAELAPLAGASAEEAGAPAGGSGWSSGAYAALAGGLAAVAVALSAGAWYARRRLLR